MDTTHETFAQRFKRLRIERRLTQIQLAKLAKVSQASISDIERGRNEGSESMVELAMALGVPAEYLAHGRMTITRPKHLPNISDVEESVEIDLANNEEFVQIKRSTLQLSAGITGFAIEPLLNDELPPIVFRKDWFESRRLSPGKLLAVKVKGDSMLPGLSPGDTVVIDTDQTNPKDGVVFAINYEGELTIKRLVRDSGSWWVMSDNPDQSRYPRKACQGSECIIIGRIIHKQSEYI